MKRSENGFGQGARQHTKGHASGNPQNPDRTPEASPTSLNWDVSPHPCQKVFVYSSKMTTRTKDRRLNWKRVSRNSGRMTIAKATCVVLSLEAPAKEQHTRFGQLVFCHSTETRWLFCIYAWGQNTFHRHYYQPVRESLTTKYTGCSVVITPCVFRSITCIEDPGHWGGVPPQGQLRVAGCAAAPPLVSALYMLSGCGTVINKNK